MILLLRKAAAFIRRDFQVESGYKVNFIIGVLNSMVILVFFYFLNKLISEGGTPDLGRYGGNYLSFVVIGFSFARYFQLTITMFLHWIHKAPQTGCREALTSSQTDSLTIVVMSSFYGLISGAVQLPLILIAGAVIMKVNFSHM